MESGVRLGPRGCPGEQGRTMGWQTWVQIPPAFRPVDLKQVTAPESPLPQLHRRIPATEEPSHSLNYSQDARNHHLCPSCYPPSEGYFQTAASSLGTHPRVADGASCSDLNLAGSLQLKIHPLSTASGYIRFHSRVHWVTAHGSDVMETPPLLSDSPATSSPTGPAPFPTPGHLHLQFLLPATSSRHPPGEGRGSQV